RSRSHGGAQAGRRADRARSGQDGVLQQREPRVPDPAHAHAGAARRRAARAGSAGRRARAIADGAAQRRAAPQLVNTLLDFSRIEAGRAQAVYEPVDIAALTADLGGAFRSAVERAGLDFVVECASIAEPVWLDRQMWEKIVLNLLSNALTFTFEGRIVVRLRDA